MFYNFKNFFVDQKPIHYDVYFSNGHFLLNKSILKKSQLEYINSFEMQEDKIKGILPIFKKSEDEDVIREFNPTHLGVIPQDGLKATYNFVLEKVESSYVAMKEEYYNFIQSAKCKIYVINNMLSVWNKDNEFIGIVMTVRAKPEQIEKAIDYNSYIISLQKKEEQKKQDKLNSKKCLYISDNKAIVRSKKLTCIADIIKDEKYRNVYVEENEKSYGEVFIDLGIVYMGIGRTLDRKTNVEGIEYSLQKCAKITLDSYKEYINNCLNNNQFINVAEIKLMELAGESPEYIQKLIEHRQKVLDLREQKHKEEEAKREKENQEYVDKQNKIAEDLINNAEQAIINKQNVVNKDITIYKSKYESSTTSLILYLMKKYDINVPLKVQGWINKALANIVYDAEYDDYSYQYYKSSADSKVFAKYLFQLVYKIKEKHGIITVAS